MQVTSVFFSSVLSITGACIYILLRTGFPTEELPVFKVLGFSLLLLILPIFLNKRIPENHRNKWHCHPSFLLFVLLLLFCLFGYCLKAVTYDYAIVVTSLGYVLFVWLLVKFLKATSISKIILCLVSSIWLSLFIVAILYSTHIKPLFYEDLAIEELVRWYYWKIDTLFHLANSQMYNTYGLPSSGLDGLKYIPYHYGANILYTELANFLKIKLFDAYILFPVIFINAVFLSTFLFLVSTIRTLINEAGKVGYVFVIVLFMGFIGFVTNRISGDFLGLPRYQSMLLDSPILFVSDSYTVSLIFLNILIVLMLSFYNTYKLGLENVNRSRVFLWIIVPLIFFWCGFSKVSTLYIAAFIVSYLFLRLKLYKDLSFIISYIVLMIGGGSTYFLLMRDTTYWSDKISWFSNFSENILNLNAIVFFVFHFFWFWALLFLFKSNGLIGSTKQILGEKKLIGLEVIAVIIAASLIPAFLLKIGGGHLYYFTEVPAWYSVALVLAYLPLFRFNRHRIIMADIPLSIRILWNTKSYVLTNSIIKSRVILLFLISIPFFVVFSKNTWNYTRLMVNINYTSRLAMLTGIKELPGLHKFTLASTFHLEEKILSTLKSPLTSSEVNPKVPPTLDFINKLSKLNTIPLSEKRESIVYVDFDSLETYLPMHCFEKPFLIPALSGMASLHGGVTKQCLEDNSWFGGFGFESYVIKGTLNSDLNYLKLEANKKGFKWLYYYDVKSGEFNKIDCEPA